MNGCLRRGGALVLIIREYSDFHFMGGRTTAKRRRRLRMPRHLGGQTPIP